MRAVIRATILLVTLTVLFAGASTVSGFDKKAFRMREDFGAEALYDCYIQYYYYMPCPTYSWFWGISNEGKDTYGVFFMVGDVSMGSGQACDPLLCFSPYTLRVLDFAGYGTAYPGLFSVKFEKSAFLPEGITDLPEEYMARMYVKHGNVIALEFLSKKDESSKKKED